MARVADIELSIDQELVQRIKTLEGELAAALAEIERLQQSIRDSYLATSCRGLTDGRD